MIDHDAYEAAERQRDAQRQNGGEASEDAIYLPQLVSLFETRGAAFVGANLARVSASFPPGFVGRHVHVIGGETKFQRASLNLVLDEAA